MLENPAYLIGIPFALIGILGLTIAASLFAVPADGAAAPRRAAPHAGHPEPAEYVVVFIILAAITAVEVALFYVNASQNLLIPVLLALSAVKFFAVILWFMHLKFDNPIFTSLFLGGLGLAIALFIIVITTLKAGLV